MKTFLKNHFHPLGGRLIYWNILILILVKAVLPQSSFQLASFIDTIPVFDSRDIIKETNQARTLNNLPILSPNSNLDLAASEKLNDMAVREYFAHVSPSGVSPWHWIKKSGYKYNVAGENLAIGFFTAKETLKAWLDSPSHRDNILDKRYRDIGVAVRSVEINDQNGILVVQVFGAPNTSPADIKIAEPIQESTKLASPILTTPIASEALQIQGEIDLIPSTIQYTSSENKNSVDKPVRISLENDNQLEQTSKFMANIFSSYFLVIASISVFAFLIYERNRSMALKLSLNLAIFILSIIIPAAEITFEGLIF